MSYIKKICLSMTFTAGAIGGNYKRSLTMANMYPHDHRVSSIPDNLWVGRWVSNASGGNLWEIYSTATDSDQVPYLMAEINRNMKAEPFSLLNPHQVVYYWRRTS